jgi:hypothetical protein
MRGAPLTAILLRLLLAAGALVAGLDLHAFEVRAVAGPQEAPGEGIQAHGNDCPHHEHAPDGHDPHGCVACKAGAARAEGLPPDATVRPALASHETRFDTHARIRPARVPGGTLGARGPPGTNG